MSRLPYVVLLLATRCLYWGYILSEILHTHLLFHALLHRELFYSRAPSRITTTRSISMNLFVVILVVVTMWFCCCCCSCCPCVIVYTTQQKQDEIVSTTRKTTMKIEIFINCLIFKNSYLLHCNICMAYLCSSQTPNDRMYRLPDVVLLLATRCHYLGVNLMSYQPHLTYYWSVQYMWFWSREHFFPYHFPFVYVVFVTRESFFHCICCFWLYIWFLQSSTLV